MGKGALVVWCVAAIGCGRYGFAPEGVGDGDAQQQGSGSIDANLGPPNHVFVSRSNIMGTFGGRPAADAFCASAATSAGLSGTYVAWISTTSLDAIDVLSGSRGWVRTDGVPVADTPASLVGGAMFDPISVDEAGQSLAGVDRRDRSGERGHDAVDVQQLGGSHVDDPGHPR